jgi:hypothetical protein
VGRLLLIKPESFFDEVVHGLFRKRNFLRAEEIACSGKSNGCGFFTPYIRDIGRLMIHLRIKVNNP